MRPLQPQLRRRAQYWEQWDTCPRSRRMGAEADFRSDQFSFGSVLTRWCAASPHFRKILMRKPRRQFFAMSRRRLVSRMFEAPAPFIWILERCLSKDPQLRYASTRDLARDLAAVRDRVAVAPARDSEVRLNNLSGPTHGFRRTRHGKWLLCESL